MEPWRNITESREYKILQYSLTVIVVILNTLVVISSGLIVKTGPRLKRKVTFLFLGNLSLTEIVNIFTALIKNVLNVDPQQKLETCLIMEAVRVTPYIAHLYSILLIAFDRFIFISNGLKYDKMLYPQRARILICVTWALGMFVGILIPLGWRRFSVEKCKLIAHIVPKEYILFLFVITATPAIFTLILYTVILFRAIKKINENKSNTKGNDNDLRAHRGSTSLRSSVSSVENSESEVGASNLNILESKTCIRKKIRAIYFVLMIMVCYTITWLPFLTWITVYSYTCDNNMEFTNTSNVCKSIKYMGILPIPIIHGIANPLIYAWWHQGFRQFSIQKIISFKNRMLKK